MIQTDKKCQKSHFLLHHGMKEANKNKTNQKIIDRIQNNPFLHCNITYIDRNKQCCFRIILYDQKMVFWNRTQVISSPEPAAPHNVAGKRTEMVNNQNESNHFLATLKLFQQQSEMSFNKQSSASLESVRKKRFVSCPVNEICIWEALKRVLFLFLAQQMGRMKPLIKGMEKHLAGSD